MFKYSSFECFCLCSPILEKLGTLTNDLLKGVPPKGTPFPRIDGPKTSDKVALHTIIYITFHLCPSILKIAGLEACVHYLKHSLCRI